MIKGRDSRPAAEFLRKYAHIIGPVENLYSPVVSEVNGQSHANQMPNESQPSSDSQMKDDTSPLLLTSSTTQIRFANDDGVALQSNATTTPTNAPHKSDTIRNSNDISDYFKELVESLSLCLRIDEINSIDITRHFRSAKYEMVLSLQSVYAMKHFLAKSGHVMILHILQCWFSLDIREYLNELQDDSDMDDMDDTNDIETSEISNNGIDNNHGINTADHSETENEFDFRDSNNSRLNKTHSEIRNLIAKVQSEIRTVNGMSKVLAGDIGVTNRTDSFPTSSLANSLPSVQTERKSFSVVQNKYLQNVRASVIRSRKLELPMRIFNVLNADHLLSSCDIDKDECHLVCGFEESTIKLWQLNQSKMRGRKPFSPFSSRLCEWRSEYCESSSEDEDSDDDTPSVQHTKMGLFARPRTKLHAADEHTDPTRIGQKNKFDLRREFQQRKREEGKVDL